MADFIEQATLRVRDQSSKKINDINNAIVKLLKTARQVNKLKIDLAGVDKAKRKVDGLTKSLKAIPKSRTVTVNTKLAGTKGVSDKLANLARMRNVTIKARLMPVGMGGRSGGGFLPPAQTQGFGRSLARSFLSTIRSSNAGQVIARGFLASIGGQAFQSTQQVVGTATRAPLNKETALQRFRASRGAETATADQAVVQDIATQITRQFKGVNEANIIINAGEAAARVGNIQTPEGQAQLTEILTRMAKSAAALQQATGATAESAAEQARIIEGVVAVTGARGAEADAIVNAAIKGVLASGGDLSGMDVKRVVQQLGALRSNLGERSLLQALVARDEGGQRGTGEIRQMFEDFTRGNLNKADKAAQIDVGLRTKEGRAGPVAEAMREDLFGAIDKFIIPLLQKARVNQNDASAVADYLDNQVGLSKQGGLNAITDYIVNRTERRQEEERARQARPEVFVNEPTTQQVAQQVQAQFENVADAALKPLLPVVQTGLNAITQSLSAINQGTATVSDFAKLGGGAAAAGVGAGVLALKSADAVTRPLALAGIGLNSSAVALDAAAAALTGAAAVQAGKNALPGGKGGPGLLGMAGWVGIGATLASFIADRLAETPQGQEAIKAYDKEQKAMPDSEQLQLEGVKRLTDWLDRFTSPKTATVNDLVDAQIKAQREAQQGAYVKGQEDAAMRYAEQQQRQQQEAMASVWPQDKPVTVTADKVDIASPAPTITTPPTAANANDPLSGLVPGIGSMTEALNSAPSELETAFSTGTTGLTNGVQQFSAAAAQFGPMMGASLLANAPQIGQAIGQAIVGMVSGATVNVTTQDSAVKSTPVNTGAVGQPAG